MDTFYFDFSTIGKFSYNDMAYAMGNHDLEDFYQFTPHHETLNQVAEERMKFPVDRKLLVNVIKRQYQKFCQDDAVFERITQLENPETFTIITAHQPTLLTGPLYFIYKALSAIKVAENYNESQDRFRAQAIFVIGGEDHDFDEMNHLNLFGKKIVWEDHQGGSVGRYQTDSLRPVLEEVYGILGQSSHAQILINKLKKAFDNPPSYGQAMQHFVHELLGQLGILVVHMDEIEFKKKMIPFFIDDLVEHTSHRVVQQIQESFSAAGFDQQAFVRPINLFYLTRHDRDRTEKGEDGHYYHVKGGENCTQEEMINEVNEHPDRFSPNVILRPVYQEIIFPNLAYVGGGGEISYWLERKNQFRHLNVFYPMLIRRDSFQLISAKDFDTIHEWGFTLEDLMLPENQLVEKYLTLHGREEIDLSREIDELTPLEEAIQAKVDTIDPSLVARIGAQFAKFKNDLQAVEKRLKKSEKQSHDSNISKIKKIQSKLFPGNGLQERSDNFMSWYILHGEGFFRVLLDSADPFDARMKTILI